jgi:hypothetical protein
MVGSIGGFNPTAFMATAALNRSATSSTSQSSLTPKASEKSSADVFMDYMKKSPAERMEENWLKAHGLTKEKLAKMSPKEQEAIMKQMKSEIEASLKEQTETKAKVDILA